MSPTEVEYLSVQRVAEGANASGRLTRTVWQVIAPALEARFDLSWYSWLHSHFWGSLR